METNAEVGVLAAVAKPQFERRKCGRCQGAGKVREWVFLKRKCAACKGRGEGLFVCARIGAWVYLPLWLATQDGQAYDQLVNEKGTVPTWREIDHRVFSEIEAEFQSIQRTIGVRKHVERLGKAHALTIEAWHIKK